MQRNRSIGIKAIVLHDPLNFVRVRDLEDLLSPAFRLWKNIKFQLEGLLEKFWKELGKFSAFGNDSEIVRLKAVAEQQDTKALRQRTAAASGYAPTHFLFDTGGK